MSEQKHAEPGLKYDAGKPGYELVDFSVFHDLEPRSQGLAKTWDSLSTWADRGGGDLHHALEDAASLLCVTMPLEAMRHEVARVLEFGARKYQAHNWRKGMRWSRLIGAAMRHLAAYERGELTDPETGLHHLGHFGCCIMFLLVYQRDGLGTDDRYPEPGPEYVPVVTVSNSGPPVSLSCPDLAADESIDLP
jgi:hypothetical protein